MPTVRSSSYARHFESGNNNVTLACDKPTGTAQNDILYAGVTHCRVGDQGITPPSGWTKIGFIAGDGQNNSWNSLTVYRKVAGASEPANYSWAGLQEAIVIGIVAVLNGDTTTPESDLQTYRDDTYDVNWVTPSVDPVGAAELLLSFNALECGNVFNDYSATPPTGMTELIDQTTPTSNWAGLQVAYQALSSGNVTGTKTWTGANSDWTMGLCIAVKAAASAPVTIDANTKTAAFTPQTVTLRETINAITKTATFTNPKGSVETGITAKVATFTATRPTVGFNEQYIVNGFPAVFTASPQPWLLDQGLTPAFATITAEPLVAQINQVDRINAAVATFTSVRPLFTIGAGTILDAVTKVFTATPQAAKVQLDFRLSANVAAATWSRPTVGFFVSDIINASPTTVSFLPLTATFTGANRINVNLCKVQWQPKRAWLTPVIGDKRLSQAIREAYASAPPDIVTLETIEIWHPNFTAPIRVVRNFENFTAKLEATAPRNAGQMVTFQGYAFELRLPDEGEGANGELELVIDNVDQVIMDSIDLSTNSNQQIEVIYRPYLSHDTTGPQMNPPMILYIKQIEVTVFQVKAICDFGEVLNRRFPFAEYTTSRFSGL